MYFQVKSTLKSHRYQTLKHLLMFQELMYKYLENRKCEPLPTYFDAFF